MNGTLVSHWCSYITCTKFVFFFVDSVEIENYHVFYSLLCISIIPCVRCMQMSCTFNSYSLPICQMPLPCHSWFSLLYIGQDIGRAFEVILFFPKGFRLSCVCAGGGHHTWQAPQTSLRQSANSWMMCPWWTNFVFEIRWRLHITDAEPSSNF